MYPSRRETLWVASLMDSLLLPTLTRTDARSAGHRTSALPVTWTSRTQLPELCLLTVRTSSPCSFSLPESSRPAGTMAAKTRLGLSMMERSTNRLPAAIAKAQCSSGFVGYLLECSERAEPSHYSRCQRSGNNYIKIVEIREIQLKKITLFCFFLFFVGLAAIVHFWATCSVLSALKFPKI